MLPSVLFAVAGREMSTRETIGAALVLMPCSCLPFMVFTRNAASRLRMFAVFGALSSYLVYLSAAVLSGAAFPQFIRGHLFDGLGPAAVVAFLIHRIFGSRTGVAGWSRLHTAVMASASATGGALVFGGIAAIAVFSAGMGRYEQPIRVAAGHGALMFGAILGAMWLAYRPEPSLGELLYDARESAVADYVNRA